jgi:hypothetical protein
MAALAPVGGRVILGPLPIPDLGQPEVDSAGLGRLTHVAQPREVWLTEAGHFTPWLADNLDVLAEEMGLSLTLTATEVPVGEFRLDIKAETADGRVVIIENQLQRTDHGHLGQLLVYASGLEAVIVVWVAPAFRDDHRRTLDWLNERTDEGVSFFGVEVGIVQIGNGPRAPVFDVVARPNDWQKHVKAVAGGGPLPVITPLNEVRQEFFLEALAEIALMKPGIRIPSKQSANWLSFASGPFGYWAISVTQDRRIRLEAYLDSGDQERNKRLFDHARSRIAAPPGLEISWERLDAKRASRIACYYDEVPPFDDAGRVHARQWTVSTFGSLYDTYNAALRTVATELRNSPPATASDVLTAPQRPDQS